MAPNRAIPTEKSIRFSSLAAVGPETILSRPEALNASGSPELSTPVRRPSQVTGVRPENGCSNSKAVAPDLAEGKTREVAV